MLCKHHSLTSLLYSSFFAMMQQPQSARAPSLSRIHHTRSDSSGRVTSPTPRVLPDNTQHSHETDIHASRGIRTHNPSKRAVAYPSLRPRGHWNRPIIIQGKKNVGRGGKEFPAFIENRFFTLFKKPTIRLYFNRFYPFHVFILYCGQTNLILYTFK